MDFLLSFFLQNVVNDLYECFKMYYENNLITCEIIINTCVTKRNITK